MPHKHGDQIPMFPHTDRTPQIEQHMRNEPSVRPSMAAVMMSIAELVAQRSTCARLQVGAVITDLDLRQVLSFGYNGNWAGGPNECDYSEAGKCGCIHAEENALIKLTSSESGLALFSTTSPCAYCAKRIVNQGRITNVYYRTEYRDRSGVELLRKAGIRSYVLSGARIGSL